MLTPNPHRALRALQMLMLLLTLAWTVPACAASAELDARLLRYPDISAQAIVFSYADDLWLLPREGGMARRLGTTTGEKRARFSPDGRTLAYSAVRDGLSRVYTLPIKGGVPRQLSYHPAGARVAGWQPDGRSVLVASTMTSERPNFNQLFLLPREGGMPQRLPMPFGETATYSPDGQQLVYTIHKDFQEESWKRYRGGRAPKLWLYDFRSRESRRLTDGDYPDSEPAFIGERLYFLSERGAEHRSNLWVIDRAGAAPRQVTKFTDHDVRHPAGGAAGLVFTAGGRLYRMEPGSEKVEPVRVELADEQAMMLPTMRSVGDQLVAFEATNGAALVAVEARGELFTIDRESGVALNRTRTSSSAERHPAPSPDGRWLAYFSDASGEYQLHLQDLRDGGVRVLSRFKEGMRYKPQWSPDGRWLVFIDHRGDLHLTEVASGQDRIVMRTHQLRLMEPNEDLVRFRVSWSHDSAWFAFASALENRNHALFAYEVAKGQLRQLTSGYFNDFAPVFDPRGDYLYCLSYRNFQAVHGDVDDVWTYANSTTISAISLRRDVPAANDKRALKAWRARSSKLQAALAIEVDGFESRLVTMPPDDGNIDDLAATADQLIYLSRPRSGSAGPQQGRIKAFKLLDQKDEPLVPRAEAMRLSPDGSQLVVLSDRKLSRLAVGPGRAEPEDIALSGLKAWSDPSQEFRQMLREAWRYHRDFFYDPGMHGRDWNRVWQLYEALLPGVKTENDLGFMLRELSAELGAGHVVGSATPRPAGGNGQQVGLLGVDFERVDGAYRIRRILDAGPRSAERRSPLAEPGVDAREGDFVLAVNGRPLDADSDPWQAFIGEAGKLVQLTLARGPKREQRHEVWVRCLNDEQKLRELVWVEANRRRVLEASGGRIGYLYLPDTSANGQNDLMRQYRAQHHLPALLVDERFNRGGALGDRLVELLNRPALAYFGLRNGMDYPLPTVGHGGPKALLTNGWSYSGGDGFPLLFQNAKLGPLIGSRTWGGLIGPGLFLPLINGGVVSAPPQRVYNPDGTWSGGNEGVSPDLYVETDPGALMQGRDPHLERGIAYLLKALDAARPRPKQPAVERFEP